MKIRLFLTMMLIVSLAAMSMAQDFMQEPNLAGRQPGKVAAAKGAPALKTAAYSPAQLLNALEMGGDQLLRWQHVNGGWTWPEDFSDTTVATPYTNQIGVVARALVQIDQKFPAKDYIGDGSIQGTGARYSGEKLREYVLSMSPKKYYYAPDRTFMVELSEYTGDMDYKTSATQEWAWVKANNPAFSTAWNLVDYFVTNRESVGMFNAGYGYGLSVWDLAGYAAGAEKVGDHTYAKAILDYVTTEQDWTSPPSHPDAHWNDTANGYNKTILDNFIKRWDDNEPTSTTAETEWFFIGGAGHMMWAMNIVDASAYAAEITALKTRLLATQQASAPNVGAYTYGKLGYTDVGIQDMGYAMMGIRNVGEVASGQAATEWCILNQETADPWTGMWREPGGDSYQENNSECMQGMWEVAEGEQKPWVTITVGPMGNHVDRVPVGYKIFDIQSDTATVMVEYTLNNGSNWYVTSNLQGAATGLPTSPSGVEHTIEWMSFQDTGLSDHNCKLRITARDDASPGEWGSPAGITGTFTVLNSTVPVELSVISID